MKLPMLYARDKKQRIKEWNVEVEGSKITVFSGIEGGKKKPSVSYAKPKNIGKTNETTPEEQAVIEAKAKWVKQIDRKGYVENIEDFGKQFRPMLAKDYLKSKTFNKLYKDEKLYWNMKLDGVRCYVENGKRTMSRGGTEYFVKNPVLIEQIAIFEETLCNIVGVKDLILDSELYIHGMLLQQIQKAVKKGKEVDPKLIECHIFDFYSEDKPELGFVERYNFICEAFRRLQEIHVNFVHKIKLVEAYEFEIDELDRCLDYAKEKGYEGIILRRDKPYEVGARSNTLWKVKRFLDKEYPIVGVQEDKLYTDKDGVEIRQGSFICKNEDGLKFAVRPIGENDGLRLDLLLHPEKYIGELLKVKYQDFTKDNLPTFATGICIRTSEDM